MPESARDIVSQQSHAEQGAIGPAAVISVDLRTCETCISSRIELSANPKSDTKQS